MLPQTWLQIKRKRDCLRWLILALYSLLKTVSPQTTKLLLVGSVWCSMKGMSSVTMTISSREHQPHVRSSLVLTPPPSYLQTKGVLPYTLSFPCNRLNRLWSQSWKSPKFCSRLLSVTSKLPRHLQIENQVSRSTWAKEMVLVAPTNIWARL